MLTQEIDQYTPIIAKYFRIDETFMGDEKKGMLARYRGELYDHNSEFAYDQISQALRPEFVTPLFRIDDGRQVIQLMKGIVQPKPARMWGNIVAFILTVFSVTFAGAFYFSTGELPASITGWASFMLSGLTFAIPLMIILVFHEFGHYLAGRFHKTVVTLPFFIPFPFSIFGTMGAFIQLKEPPRNRRILLDIGLAGPLAGVLVAIPILILGIYLSPIQRLPVLLPAGQGFEGNSILYLLIKFIVKGQLFPQPVNYAGLSPIIYWIRYFFTGHPIPAGGLYLDTSPIAWAGWAGLLVTCLNLIPAGQLDGGHIMYVLIGKKSINLLPFILVALIFLGFAWSGWWIWAVLIFFLGRSHAEPLDQITPLDPKRKALAILGLIVFVLVFIPAPLVFVP